MKLKECFLRTGVLIVFIFIVVPLVCLLGLVKFLVCFVVSKRYPELRRPNLDDYLMLLSYDMQPDDSIYSVGMTCIERDATLEEIKEAVWTFFLNQGNSKMLFRAVSVCGYWFWENTDAYFDLDYHVCYLEGLKNHSDPVTEDEVYEILGRGNPVTLTNRPRWRISVVPNLKRKGCVSEKNVFALIYHGHHSYGDGDAIVQLFHKTPGTRAVDNVQQSEYPNFTLLLQSLRNLFYMFDTMITINGTNIKDRRPLEAEDPVYHACSSIPIDIEVFRFIRRQLLCDTTSILLATLAEAVNVFSRKHSDYQYISKSLVFLAELLPPGLLLYQNSANTSTLSTFELPDADLDMLLKLTAVQNKMKDNRRINIHLLKVLASVVPHIADRPLYPNHLKNIGFTSVAGFLQPVPGLGKWKINEVQSLTPPERPVVMMCSFSACYDHIRLSILMNPCALRTRDETQLLVDTWRNCILNMYNRTQDGFKKNVYS